MTKDERFLLQIYKHLQSHHNLDGVVDPEVIRKELNFTDHLLKNILKGLMQANLVRRYSNEEIGLTERGKEVAKQLF